MKVLKDPTKPKKKVTFSFVEHKEFTTEHGLDDAPPIKDYSVFGNVSPKPDFEIRRPESPKFNIQYEESTVMAQPVRSTDRSIHQKETPKNRKRFNLFNVCLSEPKTD